MDRPSDTDKFTRTEQFTLIFFVMGNKLWLPLSELLHLDWQCIEKEYASDGLMLASVGYLVGFMIGSHTREQTIRILKDMTGHDPLVSFEVHPI